MLHSMSHTLALRTHKEQPALAVVHRAVQVRSKALSVGQLARPLQIMMSEHIDVMHHQGTCCCDVKALMHAQMQSISHRHGTLAVLQGQ